MTGKKIKWRSSFQIRGYIALLTFAINHPDQDSRVKLDLKTAQGLLEICQQARYTEEGHEEPR